MSDPFRFGASAGEELAPNRWTARDVSPTDPIPACEMRGHIAGGRGWRKPRGPVRTRPGEGRQTEHISDALVEHLQSGKPGSPCDHVLLKGAVQRTRFGKQSFERKVVAERIQSYLWRLNADMMVWGHVADADKALHLTVTPRASERDHGGGRYVLDERTLTLPPDFTGDLGAAIAALLIGESRKLIEGSGRYIAPLARTIADRSGSVLAKPLPGVSALDRGRL